MKYISIKILPKGNRPVAGMMNMGSAYHGAVRDQRMMMMRWRWRWKKKKKKKKKKRLVCPSTRWILKQTQ